MSDAGPRTKVEAARSAPFQPQPGRTPETAPTPKTVATPKPTPGTAPLASLDVSPAQLAGPKQLGRSVVIGPADAIPEPWADRRLDEVTIGPASVDPAGDAANTDDELVERLHLAWRTRTPLIIRWNGPAPTADLQPAPDPLPPFYELGPGYRIPGERLRFAATANAVVSIDGEVSFAPLQMALALGAELIATATATDGDCQRADGTSLWVDGGPLDLDLPGHLPPGPRVVPRVQLVSGRLIPLTGGSEPNSAEADDYQIPLAPDQVGAVTHRGGPARILAPAGSGKTRVLTERTRYLVDRHGVHPSTVALVAYNRRARDEMAERLDGVGAPSGQGSGLLTIRTLNSLALAIAKGSGQFSTGAREQRDLNTIDERRARAILSDIVPGKRRKSLTDPLEPWIDALAACRLGLRDPNEVEASYGGDIAGFGGVLNQYRSYLADRNLLDFDEQILRAIERLLTSPAALHQARSTTPVLLVDEFQDLTPAHLLLVRLLAGPAGELYAVGDDDQTIYGYSGASPEWLVGFEQFFPGAADHRLTVNYRCPADVVAAADNLLGYNYHRVAKAIQPSPDRPAEGMSILSGDPQSNLVDHIQRLMDGGAPPSDIAVLARVNAALLPPALHLGEVGIDVAKPAGLDRSMVERSGVGAALAWLRLATAPEQGLNGADVRLALRRPPRSLHPRINDWASEQTSVRDLQRLADRLNTERDAANVASFADDIEGLRSAAQGGATTAELLDLVYEQIGLLRAAGQLDTSQRTARRAAHADELTALAAVAPLHEDPGTFDMWLTKSIDRLGQQAVASPGQPATGAVTLATVHTTKGLEWPHVIVHDVRDNLYPHRLADDIEEERRIFHVAITRGRETVAVTTSGPPSPFVAQLSDPAPADLPPPVVSSGRNRPSGGGRSASGKKSAGTAADSTLTGEQETVRDALLQWRRERHKSDGVPAYVVFDNKTLAAIAARKPTDLGELSEVAGVGPVKLERYGDEVLGVISSIN